MNENPHEVFKSKEDYERWEPYILQCDLIEGLSSDEKKRAKQAIEYLRTVLGVNFLKRAIRHGHPLNQLFLQVMPWRRVKLIGLAEAIEALQGAENFNRVLKRIRAQPKKHAFVDGYTVLQTAYQYLKVGFQVCFVDEEGSHKKSDIKLLDEETGEEIFVEVSTLKIINVVAGANRASQPVFDLQFGALEQAQLTMYAEMQDGFDESCAANVVKQLNEVIAEAKASGELRELVNEYIVAGIAPNHKIQQLNQWALERSVSQDVAGPPVTLSELSRVQRKIREKMEEGQLPGDKPGIIVISALSSFLFHFHDLSQILGKLEKQANAYPNLLAIVLSQGYVEEPLGEMVVEKIGPHIVINRVIAGFLKEPIVILRNQAFALDISSSTLAKIHRAFV